MIGFSFVLHWDNATRTLELIFSQVEVLQVGEVADGRRDDACAPQGMRGKVP